MLFNLSLTAFISLILFNFTISFYIYIKSYKIRYKEDLSIIVIGPMTNIACAIIKDHNLEKLIG